MAAMLSSSADSRSARRAEYPWRGWPGAARGRTAGRSPAAARPRPASGPAERVAREVWLPWVSLCLLGAVRGAVLPAGQPEQASV